MHLPLIIAVDGIMVETEFIFFIFMIPCVTKAWFYAPDNIGPLALIPGRYQLKLVYWKIDTYMVVRYDLRMSQSICHIHDRSYKEGWILKIHVN